jgi:DNA-binding NarL/FixJ family response regulator
MPDCRVVLLSNRSLFASAVKTLLEKVESLQLCVTSVDDPGWIAKLSEVQPDAIVFDSGDASRRSEIVASLLECCPNARIISLNLLRQGIDVYRRESVLQTDLNGLLEAIQA